MTYQLDGCVLKIEENKTKRCQYCYKVNNEISYKCYLLSEVGERYQSTFREIIKKHGLVIKTIEGSEKPWMYDCLDLDKLRSKEQPYARR